MYLVNPKRGCGTKVEDSSYAEGGTMSPNGALRSWTWILGTMLEGGINVLSSELPSRGIVFINPAATLTICEPFLSDQRFNPEGNDEPAIYQAMQESTKIFGLADHVGKSHYTADAFRRETESYGPSRRIPKTTAKILWDVIYNKEIGSLPIFFSHSRIPLFRDVAERETALEYCLRLFPEVTTEDRTWLPTWELEGWGMYARRHHNGFMHWGTIILAMVDALEGNSPHFYSFDDNQGEVDGLWDECRQFFKNLNYHEAIYGASWISRITITAANDGSYDHDFDELDGVFRVNLKEVGVTEPEEQNATD